MLVSELVTILLPMPIIEHESINRRWQVPFSLQEWMFGFREAETVTDTFFELNPCLHRINVPFLEPTPQLDR